jgi:hypothetical protein
MNLIRIFTTIMIAMLAGCSSPSGQANSIMKSVTTSVASVIPPIVAMSVQAAPIAPIVLTSNSVDAVNHALCFDSSVFGGAGYTNGFSYQEPAAQGHLTIASAKFFGHCGTVTVVNWTAYTDGQKYELQRSTNSAHWVTVACADTRSYPWYQSPYYDNAFGTMRYPTVALSDTNAGPYFYRVAALTKLKHYGSTYEGIWAP